jgi:hypothetical protein
LRAGALPVVHHCRRVLRLWREELSQSCLLLLGQGRAEGGPVRSVQCFHGHHDLRSHPG